MGKPWKELEKKTAEALGGTRIVRDGDYGESNVDVVLDYFPQLRIDCKYRAKHAHHSLVETIREKYCTEDGMWPVLVTKHRSSHREYVTLDLSLMAALMKHLYKGKQNDNEDKHDSVSGAEAVEERKELD